MLRPPSPLPLRWVWLASSCFRLAFHSLEELVAVAFEFEFEVEFGKHGGGNPRFCPRRPGPRFSKNGRDSSLSSLSSQF